MMYPFRHLVFEGGGVKGIAYAGALKVLEKKGLLSEVTHCAGTSAGAITAALVSAGYTPLELKRVLFEMDFQKFMDDSWFLGNVRRLVKQFGWYKGDAFRKWFSVLLEGKGVRTFADLKIELKVVGTNLSTGRVKVFGKSTPKMRVADAVHASMAIPLFFRAVSLDHALFVDGGVLYNYPLDIFDKYGADRTLGLRVDTQEEKLRHRHGVGKARKVGSLKDYVRLLAGTMIDGANRAHLSKGDWERTMYLDSLGISATDFELSERQKQDLFESGVVGAERFFSWYDRQE